MEDAALKQIVSDNDIPANSLEEIHYRVVELVAPLPRGKVLDFPAGHGRLSRWLHKMGFDVTAGDIAPENFRNPDIPVVKADLEGCFPFPDGAFDAAFCIEGPEHTENPYHTFREFARILKPGGKLIISFPNYSNLESRLRMILYGILEPVEYPDGAVPSKSYGHVSRPPFALLKMSLMLAGLSIDTVACEAVKPRQLLLYPLYLLIKLFTAIKGDKGQRKYFLRDSNDAKVLMGGRSLILLCTKQPQGAA
jgi:SAM-dependent methyltransferase